MSIGMILIPRGTRHSTLLETRLTRLELVLLRR